MSESFSDKLSLYREIESMRRDLNDLKTRDEFRILDGTTLPAVADVNTLILKSDFSINMLFRYTNTLADGNLWLSVNEWSAGRQQIVATATGDYILGQHRTDNGATASFIPYHQFFSVTSQVANPNDATNFWTIALRSSSSILGPTDNIHIFNTSTDGIGVVSTRGVPTSNRIALAGRFGVIRLYLLKTNNPGAITITPEVFYRLIAY